MKFKSKIDWWFHLVVVVFILVPILSFFFATYTLILLIGTVFVVFCVLVILPMYFFTYYILDETTLLIRGGLYYKRISYKNIERITETRYPWSSCTALSYDRIEILYSKGLGVTYISPKDKQEFIKQLNQRLVQANSIAVNTMREV